MEDIILILSLMLMFADSQLISRHSDGVCNNEGCIKAAREIRSAMDLTADPCNDFYQFACGGWTQRHQIPPDASYFSQFHIAQQRIQLLLKEILEETNARDRDSILKAKSFYKSCLAENLDHGWDFIQEFIRELGGSPILGVSDAHMRFNDDVEFDWERYLGHIKMLNDASPIIKFDITVDDSNSTVFVPSMDQPQLLMPSTVYYTSSSHIDARQQYKDFLVEFYLELANGLRQIGSSSPTTLDEIRSAVEQVLAFETDLSQIMSSKEQRIDILKNFMKTTIKDTNQTLSSDFNWYVYINAVTSKVDIHLPVETEIVVYAEDYLARLPRVLKTYPHSVIKDYVITSTLVSRMKSLPPSLRRTELNFRKAITGVESESIPWKKCVTIVSKSFVLPVAAMYVEKHFPEQSKVTVTEMVNNILLSFKQMLRDASWMDHRTKMMALIKVEEMGMRVGYPRYIVDRNNPKLDQHYEGLMITGDHFLKDDIELRKFDFRNLLLKVNRDLQEDSWKIGPVDVDAFYDKTSNTLVLPAGIMQPPFYDLSRPYSMIYGAIGNAIAHETTHGFDTSGSRYDKFGNLDNWWSDTSRERFEAATNCMKKQYGNIFYDTAGLFVNGNFTIDENIADNGGISIAYQAYQYWKELNEGREFILPGLEMFSSDQLYFVSMSQTWCSIVRPAFAKEIIQKYSHSPQKIRVKGMLTNFEEFGAAFGCRRGVDILYPRREETCRVWSKTPPPMP